MSFINSPSLDDYQDGIPDRVPPRISPVKGILIGIGVLILVLSSIMLFRELEGRILSRSGVVTGSAVDADGLPVPVEVIVFGTDILVKSDSTGKFRVEGVPVGQRQIVIASGMIAVEKSLEVQAGTENSLGEIVVPTDEEIDY